MSDVDVGLLLLQDMIFPGHSWLWSLCLLLLVLVPLSDCQSPLDLVEEEMEEEEEEPQVEAVVPKVKKPEMFLCPVDCSCTAEGSVDCAGVDLTDFPAELSDRVKQLSLQVGTSRTGPKTCSLSSRTWTKNLFETLLAGFRVLTLPSASNPGRFDSGSIIQISVRFPTGQTLFLSFQSQV